MKKTKYFLFSICLSFMTSDIIAQTPQIQTKTWKDGDPLFQKNSIVNNVRSDSIVSLVATFGFRQESAGFILPVMDPSWVWPKSPGDKVNIVSAEDIECYYKIVNNETVIHYVVTDAGISGNKIIDVDLTDLEAAWNFKSDIDTSARSLNNPVDTYVYVENGNVYFLITDQGNHRVIKVDRTNDKILWQYGDGKEGILSSPADAVALPNSQVLICDKGNLRAIIVNEDDKQIDWEWGENLPFRPVDVEYDSVNNEVLITDQGNNRVIKVARQTKLITWEYSNGLNYPTDADLLPGGNVLICDAGNNRLIEINYNKEIVWQLATPLKNLKDGDRFSDPNNPILIKNPGWLNMHLVIANGQPFRIGYITKDSTSALQYLGKKVDFDSLIWLPPTQMREETSIQMQFRTGKDIIAEDTTWKGPTPSEPFYTNSGQLINPVHDGHNVYQFKAKLTTTDPLYTPILNNVKVTYHYFDDKTIGYITSDVISTAEDSIIAEWKWLKFNTILPFNEDQVFININILDAFTNDTLTKQPLRASSSNSYNFVELNNIEKLKQKQSIKLEAVFRTSSSGATPILDDWEIAYDVTPLVPAKIYFVDEKYNPAPAYHLTESGQEPISYVIVKLKDPNLAPMQDAISLTITSLVSHDSERVVLSLREIQGDFLSTPGLPAVISDSAKINNDTLEVFDRDHLVVSYTDPMDPTDETSDTVLIVYNTEGTIQFLVRDVEGIIHLNDKYYKKIDEAKIGDTIYVHIMGEKDQDLKPEQDILPIIVFNYETTDEETLLVAEVPDTLQQYGTGEFISSGLRLVESTTPVFDDSLLQVYSGSRISVKYDGSISRIPIIKVYGEPYNPPEAYAASGPFDFVIAPNPYYSDNKSHTRLNLQVISAVGDFTIEKIEIYNFAGQKVTEIGGSLLNFNYPIPAQKFSRIDGWWNLNDRNAVSVSSGTYWVKISGKVVNTNKNLTKIKKLVIVR